MRAHILRAAIPALPALALACGSGGSGGNANGSRDGGPSAPRGSEVQVLVHSLGVPGDHPSQEGVPVMLSSPEGDFIKTLYTDAAGRVVFSDCPAGAFVSALVTAGDTRTIETYGGVEPGDQLVLGHRTYSSTSIGSFSLAFENLPAEAELSRVNDTGLSGWTWDRPYDSAIRSYMVFSEDLPVLATIMADGQRYFGGVRLSLSGEAPELEASGVISDWSLEGIPVSISYANTSAEEQAIGFAISATLNGLPSRYDTKGMVVAPGESRSLSALVVPPIEEGWSSELWYYGPRNAHGEAHQSARFINHLIGRDSGGIVDVALTEEQLMAMPGAPSFDPSHLRYESGFEKAPSCDGNPSAGANLDLRFDSESSRVEVVWFMSAPFAGSLTMPELDPSLDLIPPDLPLTYAQFLAKGYGELSWSEVKAVGRSPGFDTNDWLVGRGIDAVVCQSGSSIRFE